jgi:hypothetical protein
MKPTKDKKVLLLIDNHKSHVSISAITKARENGIMLLTFPPHTQTISSSHWTDVSSDPLKKYYNAGTGCCLIHRNKYQSTMLFTT